jgi:hypothetical protein
VQYQTVHLAADPIDVGEASEAIGVVRIVASRAGSSAPEVVRLSELETGIALDDFLYVLSGHPPDAAQTRDLGTQLYNALISGDVKEKLVGARDIARSDEATLRLAVSASGRLADVPWEFLYDYDRQEFLTLSNVSVVRVEDRDPPGTAYFGPFERAALVVADPQGELNFAADGHIRELVDRFGARHVEPILLSAATRDSLRNLVKECEFDLLYLLCHGKAGHISLLDPNDETITVPLAADQLGSWLRGAKRRVRLVYLNACASSNSDIEGESPAGVAQSILRTSRVDNVVAMQAQIRPEPAMQFAAEYFDRLLNSHDPESSLSSARDLVGDRFVGATPVAYTHIAGWQDLERNRLAALLGISHEGKVCVSLNSYRMGVQANDYALVMGDKMDELKDKEILYFRGVTLAGSDVSASKAVIDLVGKIVDVEDVIYAESCADADATFYFGAHHRVLEVVNEYSNFQLAHNGSWGFTDRQSGRRYETPNLTNRDYDYWGNDDFGFIEKVRVQSSWFFFICGIGSRATHGCAYWLSKNWQDLLDKYGTGPFTEVLRFPGGMTHEFGEVVART